jgi:ATP-binding cassette subfamily B protein
MMRPYRAQAAVAAVVMVGATLAQLAGPALVGYAIDEGLREEDPAALNLAGVAFLVAVLARLLLERRQYRMVTALGERFLSDLRLRVFGKLQRLSMPYFDREPTGRLVARLTVDVESMTELVQNGLVLFVTSGMLVVFSVVVLIVMSPLLALVCLLTLPPLIMESVKFRRRSNTAYLDLRERVAATLSTLQERLQGVRVIQAFGREEAEAHRFRHRSDEQLEAGLAANELTVRYFPLVELTQVATTAVAVGVGGWLAARGTITVGVVAAFVLYLANLFSPIQQLTQLFDIFQRSGAALSKLFDVLDEPVAVEGPAEPVPLPDRGTLELRGVGFSYDGEHPVLSQVNLRVEPGERLALVGPTGAGKSTLAKLVARLYDPVEGSVCFGGVDLRHADPRSLRQRIIAAPQEGHLFMGTIADNVRIGRADADDDAVAEAVSKLGLYERFAALPGGLHTELQEQGSGLSGGERQLVALARIALADPAVLILDEATSSLDPGTEGQVERALTKLMTGRTVIVIAHRLSTVRHVDRVAVVDRGRVVETGSHRQLLEQDGRYASMYQAWTRSQAS